jgi:hypothetical protein
MKGMIRIILAIYLILSFMGCATLNTYPPNYQPSDWETSMGPPDWYLNESDGRGFETVNQ